MNPIVPFGRVPPPQRRHEIPSPLKAQLVEVFVAGLDAFHWVFRLVVLDKGRVIEEGSHEELVAKGGLYAQLWQRQSGGFLLDDAPGEPANDTFDIGAKGEAAE